MKLIYNIFFGSMQKEQEKLVGAKLYAIMLGMLFTGSANTILMKV